MALRATVYRADLTVSDLDRGVYAQHALTLARHPSETEERLMVRLLAFALHADESLVFGRGLSTEDEADLWQRDATGAIELWIDVGLPDDKGIRKACGRARAVVVLAYGARRVDQWWGRPVKAYEPDGVHIDGRRNRSAAVARRALDAAHVHRAGRSRVARERAGNHRGRPCTSSVAESIAFPPGPVRTRAPLTSSRAYSVLRVPRMWVGRSTG